MNEAVFQGQVATLMKHRLYLFMGCMGLIVSNCVLGVCLLTQEQRVIVTPPTLRRAVWVSTQGVSTAYLEEMAHFWASFFLNVTPATISDHHTVLLRYVSPEVYGKVRAKLHQEAKRYVDEDLNTSFHIQTCQVTPKTLLVTGVLTSYVGTQRISAEAETVRIHYRIEQGRPLIDGIDYVGDKDAS